jgi:hypothetical protein
MSWLSRLGPIGSAYADSKVQSITTQTKGTHVDVKEANCEHQAGEQQAGEQQAGGFEQICRKGEVGRVRLP